MCFRPSQAIKCRLAQDLGNGRYKIFDTGEEFSGQLPDGVVWDDSRLRQKGVGPDEKSFCVSTPAGSWFIDGRASNCRKAHTEPYNNCWVRTGSVEDGTLHVATACSGNCYVGSGSIKTRTFHGFLRHGHLIRVGGKQLKNRRDLL